MIRVIATIAVGASVGGVLGYFGKCASGNCPLMSSWWRGALYGGTIGLLFGLSGQ